MKKSTKILNIIKPVVFIAIFLLIFQVCNRIFVDKSVEAVSKEYSEYGDDQFDVLFFGSSVMKNDIYPMQLWNEYGYASYNLGCGSQTIAESYYLMKEAISEQSPKLVVLDCFYIGYDQTYMSDAHLHYVTDAMSGIEKYELLYDLVPVSDWGDFAIEFTRYHSRWSSLSYKDFVYDEDSTYGAKVHYYSYPIGDYTITDEAEELPAVNEEYLNKIIELCEENDVELLLTTFPVDFGANNSTTGDMYQNQKYYNYIQQIADEHNINYLNFMHTGSEVGIDPETDYDGGFHMNAYGAEKLTSYIGSYISKTYDIADVRNDEEYAYMAEDYLKFTEYKNQTELQSITNFDAYLDALSDMENVTAYISVKDIQGYSLQESSIEKLQNLGFTQVGTLLEKQYHGFLGIVSGNQLVYEAVGDGEEQLEYEGTVSDQDVSMESQTFLNGNLSSIQINGQEYSTNLRGFNIVVVSNTTGEVLDQVNFDTHDDAMTCYR